MGMRFPILGKNRDLEVAPSAAKDFTLGEGTSFDASRLLEKRGSGGERLSLYCFDLEEGSALFVETPADCRLEEAPFFYSAQYAGARAIIKISREEFFRLASDTQDPGPHLAWIQSVGRSGTTLASRALGTCSGVFSLSEPDALLQVLALGPESPLPKGPWTAATQWNHDQLIDACVRLLCHEALASGSYQQLIIKPRSQFCEAFPTVGRLYPESETLFLSRAPLPWINSVFSAFLRDLDCDDPAVLKSFESSLASYVPLIHSRVTPGQTQSMGTLWALHYVSALQKFEEAKRQGLRHFSLTFEELKKAPHQHFQALFAHWRLDWDEKALAAVLKQDSQEGSGLAKSGAGRDEYQVNPRYLEDGAKVFREFHLL